MRPLILHNVPDDELYTGEDGVQRPYAMIFPEGDRQREGPRRRAIAETGSFGKSTRRSRSRTGSLPPKREDATMASADKVFSDYLANQEQASTQRKSSYNLAQSMGREDGASALAPRIVQEPTEVILRGYRSSTQQYAAISHFEQLAGRICEDYPREPPIEQRRYKSELRDPAFTRRQTMTPQEKAKVNHVAGGEHWIKVTFESADAAEAAIFASPQKILGYLVYAEPWRGLPPLDDAAVADMVGDAGMLQDEQPIARSQSLRSAQRLSAARLQRGKQSTSTLPKNWATPNMGRGDMLPQSFSPESQTIDSVTMSSSTGTASSATVTGLPGTDMNLDNGISTAIESQEQDGAFCSRIPTAKRAKLLTAEQALLPQQGLVQRIVSRLPLVSYLGGNMIGDEVPRTESGEFDYARASLYWRIMWYLDFWLGLFSHDLVRADRDD